MRILLGPVALDPSSCAACEAKSVICVSAGDVMLKEQLERMLVMDFAVMHLLGKGYAVDNAKAFAMIKSGSQFLDGHFLVPSP